MATDIGTGATVTFGTSGYNAEILTIDGSWERNASVDSSHLGTTTANDMLPADRFGSTIELDTNFLMGTKPPINGANETITIVVPNGAGNNSWSVSGHLSGFDFTVADEEKSVASLSITCSGDWTVT